MHKKTERRKRSPCLSVFLSASANPLSSLRLHPPVTLKGSYTELIHLNKLHPIHYLFFVSSDKKPFLWCTFLFFPPCRLAKKPLHLSDSILSSLRSHSFSHFPSSHTWCKKPWLALQVEREKKNGAAGKRHCGRLSASFESNPSHQRGAFKLYCRRQAGRQQIDRVSLREKEVVGKMWKFRTKLADKRLSTITALQSFVI